MVKDHIGEKGWGIYKIIKATNAKIPEGKQTKCDHLVLPSPSPFSLSTIGKPFFFLSFRNQISLGTEGQTATIVIYIEHQASVAKGL